MTIAVCIIATGNYKSFLSRIITDIEERFLLNHTINIHIFNDSIIEERLTGRVKIFSHHIPPYKFPEATLFRYEIMTSIKYDEDYLYYIDADMGIVSEVGDEILGHIVAVRHPGFVGRPCNSWEDNPNSKAYIMPDKRKHYYAGGFQGGATSFYIPAMIVMRDWIQQDLDNGITPKWHDESIFNRWLSGCSYKKILNCDYCFPESKSKAIAWGINNITPKILALEKNFKEIRK